MRKCTRNALLESGRLSSGLKPWFEVEDLVSTHFTETKFGENPAGICGLPLAFEGFFYTLLSHKTAGKTEGHSGKEPAFGSQAAGL